MAETIGSLADKIGVMELKIWHMTEQIRRPDISLDHKESCRQKVSVLKKQRDDLVQELSRLMEAVGSGRTRLRVYRQFKMYNDPIYRVR